jgi:hypothetical protein
MRTARIYICMIPYKGIEFLQPKKRNSSDSLFYQKICGNLSRFRKNLGLSLQFEYSAKTGFLFAVEVYGGMKLYLPENSGDSKQSLNNNWMDCYGVSKQKDLTGSVHYDIDRRKHRSSFVLPVDCFIELSSEAGLKKTVNKSEII